MSAAIIMFLQGGGGEDQADYMGGEDVFLSVL